MKGGAGRKKLATTRKVREESLRRLARKIVRQREDLVRKAESGLATPADLRHAEEANLALLALSSVSPSSRRAA